jgi:hypothetical protein
MANPVLGKLQGQGLIESTTAGLQQAGAQLATTPVGAALQGRGPDSLKMAGTPPAKINALAAGMKDVSSAALSRLRETSRLMEGTDAEAAAAKRAQDATVLGRVDNAIANRAQINILSKFAGLKFDEAKLDVDALKNTAQLSDSEINSLKISLAELRTGQPVEMPDGTKSDGLTTADIQLIDRAVRGVGGNGLSFTSVDNVPTSSLALATEIKKIYRDTTDAELQDSIKSAVKEANSSLTIGALQDSDVSEYVLGTGKTQIDLVNLLVSLTGKTSDEIRAMKLADLRAVIDSWETTELKNVEKLRKTLSDPASSRADRELAIQELRRLGQVGVSAGADKIDDLQKQIREGDTVTIAGKPIPVEDLFTDPSLLVQMQTWIDNPETAPAELKQYLSDNQNALNLQVSKIIGAAAAGDIKATGLTGAMQRVTDNIAAGKVHDSIKDIPAGTIETFFPGWSSFGVDAKIPVSDDAYKTSVGDAAVQQALKTNPNLTPEEQAKIRADATSATALAKDPEYTKYQKYKILQDKDLAKNAKILLTNLATINGVDGVAIFNELTPEQLRTLCQNETAVNAFKTNLEYRQKATTFKGDTNFKSEFELIADSLGIKNTTGLFANLVDNDLSPYIEIFEKAGLSNLLDIKVNSKGSGLTRRTWKTAKLNTAVLANMIKALGKNSLSDVLAGKVSDGKKQLELLFTKLNQGLSKVEEAVKPIPSEAERDDLFAKSMYQSSHADTSQVKLSKLTAEETKLQRENAANWANYNALFAASSGLMSADLLYLLQKANESKNRYNSAKSAREQFENNRAQYDKERADYKDAWWRGYEKKLNDDNAAIRQTYADLGDIFTGVR